MPGREQIIETGPHGPRSVTTAWGAPVAADETGQRIHALAAANNIRIPSGSRIDQYLRSVETNRDLPLLELVRAHQELFLLEYVLQHAAALGAAWRPVIEAAVAYDQVEPGPVDALSKGRDALFEVYLAARCAAAGLGGIRAEPDILCRNGDLTFCMAAKRLKSANATAKRAKEARRQIKLSGFPGMIALDLSPLQTEYLVIESSEKLEEFYELASRRVDELLAPHLPQIRRECQVTGIMGVLAFALVPGYLKDPGCTLLAQAHNSVNFSPAGSREEFHRWYATEALCGNTPALP